ncbi:hypothetical protein KVR01_012858 [Diaporthe batatas]|uniref:uncharacterized protein n=1 Tax=Diaporthe batatas TaxID=748121 RepID=UPI001D046EFA|nr:uncharacterized protein KVR01_012858 [Diaporthe batatas]KAG8157150.1 hypothetical protein KVR01_012858 [Diaporthe batatas]
MSHHPIRCDMPAAQTKIPDAGASAGAEGEAEADQISAGFSAGSLARTIGLPTPRLERDFRMQASLEGKVALGRSCWGERNWIGICGGEWSATWGKGTVVPGGQDAQLLTEKKSTFVDTRYLLATADAPPAHIMVRTEGWRTGPPDVLTRLLDPVEGDKVSPDEYRFRIFIRLETGDDRYRWLNEGMWIGSGVRRGLEAHNMEAEGYTPKTLEIVARRADPDVAISPYQDSWPKTFTRVAARMRAALGPQVARLEHVGSTSVPGLAAKPIVDVLLEVSNPADEASYLPALEALGFTLLFRQPKWHGHRFLFVDEKDVEVNVHVHREGCRIAADFLTFREFLRDNAWARDEYVEAKRRAAETSNGEKGGRLRYQMEKAEVLNRLKGWALGEKPSPACAACCVG